MKRLSLLLIGFFVSMTISADGLSTVPQVKDTALEGYFPLASATTAADICVDANDYRVVAITAGMLADDVKRVTGKSAKVVRTKRLKDLPAHPAVVAGTLGHSALIDQLVSQCKIKVEGLHGKWESYQMVTTEHPKTHQPLLVVIGSDRRGTAFGLTSLCEAIGVSPWYWWADVTPQQETALYVEPGMFCQGEPQVQYRGIFINDERFGGWARWAEKRHGVVGPETYRQVFELLLRLKANYLWPAMHPGTQAFNADPENARLADEYAIVMGSSHCEQMLRNNEGEWKAVNERAQRQARLNAAERKPLRPKVKAVGQKIPGTFGDFNYITNRKTMQKYWEDRVKTNGGYENTYTLGLRGIHDYPMEGANSTQERVALMQQAINDQRDMLRRNIHQPVEEIPQVLCTYEEVLDAYHNGLQVPEDVTLLWSDDKHGYCRNLCNPEEMRRKGGAGIYYHLSYHGDPDSWIWLSPLSPAFLSAELTKAYTYGARKIWVFNVGDIKPAEKEISFVMDLAWNLDRWKPTKAHDYIRYWATKTFGESVAQEIADIQNGYYQLQAGGKDAHVWFVNYTEPQIARRIQQWRVLADRVQALETQIPASLKDAYFELVAYPVRGAAMLNEYQLLARRSMVEATRGDGTAALADADRVKRLFSELNAWTHHYNEEIQQGKWSEFFNWQPYHWFRSDKIDPPIATAELVQQISQSPRPRFLCVKDALSKDGVVIESDIEGDIPLWIEALTPIQKFSKEPKDNEFCKIILTSDLRPQTSFTASATPINNVWHATHVGPMWSKVGTLHLQKGKNRLTVSDVKTDARIDRIYIGSWAPFDAEPRVRIPAYAFDNRHDSREGKVMRVTQLGYTDGVMVQPFGTPSYAVSDAPYVDYDIDLQEGDRTIEVRTLPTLHVYEGRDIRYAVQLGDGDPHVFSIHANDFTAEWRWNVLRGYASRTVSIPATMKGSQRLRIYFLDPGIVLQEVLVHKIYPRITASPSAGGAAYFCHP